MTYRLVLPPSMSRVHNVFNVSMLRKYVDDPNHVINLEPDEIADDLTFEEIRFKIVDKKNHIRRSKVIHQELEFEVKSRYPHLFGIPSTYVNFEGEIP